MNKPLRKVGIVMMAAVVLLLGNLSYYQVINSEAWAENPNNRRVAYDTYSRKRGMIVTSRTGNALAVDKPVDDRFQYRRRYPYGPMYAHVVGYQSLRYGNSGIEAQLNEFLNGSDPRLWTRRLSDLFSGEQTEGGHVRLTLVHKLQKAAYEAMVQRGYTGAVVVLDPETGAILAMVNRAIQSVYPPGSTFKLVVAAAALANGRTAKTEVTTEATIPVPNSNLTLSNYANIPCPDDTLKAALAHSCNTAFAKLAAELGPKTLRKTAHKFGIGMDNLEIPMPVMRSSLGKLSGPAAMYYAGIGQMNVRMTPLQVAMITATIANDGMPMKPYLVKELLAPDLSTVEKHDPEQLTGEPAMSEHDAQVLTEMMVASENNTSGGHKIPGVRIASKTGTAEHGTERNPLPPHVWYTAFAPVDDPEVAVAVVAENGGGQGLDATGSSVVAEVGRIVINTALGKR